MTGGNTDHYTTTTSQAFEYYSVFEFRTEEIKHIVGRWVKSYESGGDNDIATLFANNRRKGTIFIHIQLFGGSTVFMQSSNYPSHLSFILIGL